MTGYYPNSDQLVNLITKAAQTDFYFSHRITFFTLAVLFNDKEKEKEEKQRALVDDL